MTIQSFFNDVWQGTKDAVSYVSGSSNEYIVRRDLSIDKENGYSFKFWRSIPTYAGQATNDNDWVRDPLPPEVLQDVGYTKVGGEIYLDFIYNGHKIVIRYDDQYHKLTEYKEKFKLYQDKADACRALRQQGQQLAAMLQVWCNATIKLKQQPNPSQELKARIADNDRKIQQCLDECKALKGINIAVDKTRTQLQALNGLGALPALPVVAFATVGVIVVGMSVTWIMSEKEATRKIQLGYEAQAKAIDDKAKVMANPNLTPQQKQELFASQDAIIQSAQSNNAQLTKDKPGILSEAKSMLMWGLAAVAAIKLAPLVFNNNKNS